MRRKIGIMIGVALAVAACVGIVVAFSMNKQDVVEEYPSYDSVKMRSQAVQLGDYDIDSVIPANEQSGGLAENIEGDLSKAKVVIYEYADYQCDYCALFNPKVNEILADYGDDVAIVFRTYLLSYHKNGVQAALAAEAAGKQGCWQEFKDKLFEKQDAWYYASRTKFQQLLEEYFVLVAGDFGDVEKFRADMRDEDSLQKIAFSMALGSAKGLEGTPSFYIDGEKVDITSLHDKVGELLGR